MKPSGRLAVLAVALCLSGGLAAQELRLRLETELASSVERLSGGRADWRSTAFDVRVADESRRAYYGRLQTTERFDLNDSEIMVGIYQPLAGPWAVQVEAVASPTHRVLARDSVLAQIERRFDGGWGAQAGYRRSTYERSGTDLVIATVDRYFSSFRAAYSLYLGRPDGAGFGPSHRLQWSYYYGDRSFVGISAAAGKEVENVFPGGVLATQVRSFSLAGRHEFAPGWAAAYEWLAHRQGDIYTRHGFRLGVRHAF